MTDLPIYVITNKKHYWLIPGFMWLFRKYWGVDQPVNFYSYGARADLEKWGLPDYCSFTSLGRENAPVNRWSNGVLRMLDSIPEMFFILLLEDYWLNREVNTGMVETLLEYCNNLHERERLLRLDLTRDRSSRGNQMWGRLENVRIIISNRSTPYQMSFQAGIWNRESLRQVIQPAETPWESEISGTKRFQESPHLKSMFNLGTLDYPVSYRPVYRDGKKLLDLSSLTEFDRRALSNAGLLRVPKRTVLKWD